jgi:hypothetical protein
MVKTKGFIDPKGSMWVVITFERYGRMGGRRSGWMAGWVDGWV